MTEISVGWLQETECPHRERFVCLVVAFRVVCEEENGKGGIVKRCVQ